jgi:hypothetical protein
MRKNAIRFGGSLEVTADVEEVGEEPPPADVISARSKAVDMLATGEPGAWPDWAVIRALALRDLACLLSTTFSSFLGGGGGEKGSSVLE